MVVSGSVKIKRGSGCGHAIKNCYKAQTEEARLISAVVYPHFLDFLTSSLSGFLLTQFFMTVGMKKGKINTNCLFGNCSHNFLNGCCYIFIFKLIVIGEICSPFRNSSVCFLKLYYLIEINHVMFYT